MEKTYFDENLKTVGDLMDAMNSNKEAEHHIYNENVQHVMENEIKKAGYVKDEFVKEIAAAEIRRAYEDGHSSGYYEVVNHLFDCTLI